MAKLIPNAFSTFELTEDEDKQGSILTITQQQVIQNKIAEAAQQQLNLVYDTKDPLKFVQEQAYLKGQLDFGQYLIDLTANVLDIVEEENRNKEV